MNIIKTTGIFCSTNRGFGYVEMPDYPGMDLFVSANNKNSAMNRDVVEVTFLLNLILDLLLMEKLLILLKDMQQN